MRSVITDAEKLSLWDILWTNAIGGLALIDEDGTFIRANHAFCRIVEYSEPELQELTFKEITSPADADIDEALSKEVVAGHRAAYDMIKSYITKTRRVVWVHLRVVPVMTKDHKFAYFLSQVYEVPVSVVSTMVPAGTIVPSQYTPAKPSNGFINWQKIREFWPIIMLTLGSLLVGGMYALQLLGPHLLKK